MTIGLVVSFSEELHTGTQNYLEEGTEGWQLLRGGFMPDESESMQANFTQPVSSSRREAIGGRQVQGQFLDPGARNGDQDPLLREFGHYPQGAECGTYCDGEKMQFHTCTLG